MANVSSIQVRAVPSFQRTDAFTLVELLVAASVTLLLIVLLAQVFNGSAASWRRSEAQVNAYREARGALQLMARDLSATLQASYTQAGGGADASASPSPTPFPWVPTLVLQHYSAIPPDPSAPSNEEAYFLTNMPNGGSSSLCAVGYFCQWMPDAAANDTAKARAPRAYALMRQSLDSNGTCQRLKAAASATTPVAFASLFSRDGAPAPGIAQVAAYVWDLRFRIDTDLNEQVDGNATSPPGPTDHAGLIYGGKIPPYPPRLPPYVEIRFKAMSDLAARQLEGSAATVSQSTWRDTDPGFVPAGPYKQWILPNCQQFVLRVPLTNATPLPTPTPAPGS